MSRATNFMLMSFSLLQLNEKVMSSKHNRTFAIINGPENYDTLKTSLSKSFNEINDLIGINSAAADYSCLWCDIHKSDRWDTSHSFSYCNKDPHCRTLEKIFQLYQSKDNYGCINKHSAYKYSS